MSSGATVDGEGYRRNTMALWPPGTILLEDLRPAAGYEVILQPRPTEDPNDPLNWSKRRKAINFALICGYVIMVCEFIDVSTPLWGPMQDELGFSDQILDDSYAASTASLGVGSLVLIPFALKFGRRPLYLISSIAQFAISIWSANMQSVADLMLVNSLECFFGSLAEVIVQMTIADLFFVHQRGTLNIVYIWLWKMTAPLGVLIAGYIASAQGWRWVWWWNAVFIGICTLIIVFCYEETSYFPKERPSVSTELSSEIQYEESSEGTVGKSTDSTQVDDFKKGNLPSTPTEATEKGTSQDLYAVHINHEIPMNSYWKRMALTTTAPSSGGLRPFLRHMYQPIILLATIPAVTYTALVYGTLIALQDVMSVLLSTYMKKPPYNFNSHQIGLMSLPKMVGITIGSLIGGPLSDWVILFLSRRNKGIYDPEFRLWSMVPFIICIPIGALMFGFGLANGLPWPIIATGLGLYIGAVAPLSSITITYLTDSYKDILGDALVGVTIVRNTFSTAFVFALTPWIAAMGIQNVLITILVVVCAVLLCVFPLIKWGKMFRDRYAGRYEYYALRQYKER